MAILSLANVSCPVDEEGGAEAKYSSNIPRIGTCFAVGWWPMSQGGLCSLKWTQHQCVGHGWEEMRGQQSHFSELRHELG